MTYPTKYTRQYDFASYQNANPTRPLPGDKVNVDLNAVVTSVDELVEFLKTSIRSDGRLANGSVGLAQLNESIEIGFEPPTTWEPGVDYTTDSTVLHDNKFYKAHVAHRSTDGFDESKWDLIVDFGAEADAAAASATAAAASETAAAASETAAGSSASAAANSATSASDSATTATTQATNALNSATAAATSATNAATSETNAATSATAAAASAASITFASQAEAEAGVDSTKVMSPLRTAEAIAALGGSTFDYDTVALATAATIPSGQNMVRTGGYAAVGDGGGALYVKAVSEPSHAGKFQSADGAWWELAEVIPNELMFGAVSSASNAVQTAAIQSMLDYCSAKNLPCRIVASHTITSKLTIADNADITGSCKNNVKLSLGYNGDMFEISGSSVVVRSLSLDGVGATYASGRGFYISGTSDQLLEDCSAYNFGGPCLEFAFEAGIRATISKGLWHRYAYATQPAIQCSSSAETVGGRSFIRLVCSGGRLVDLAGANDVSILGCSTTFISFSSNTKKANIVGNRIANAAVSATITVSGIQHSFAGNIISGDITLSGSNIGWSNDNIVAGTLSDTNTGASPNTVSVVAQSYTPVWTAATTNPAIGNGTLLGEYERDGNYVVARAQASFGSTTTFGSGVYSFSLPIAPYTHTHEILGTAYGLDSGTSFVLGVAVISAGSSVVKLFLGAAPTNNVGPTVPVTWASGDRLVFEIRYRITSTGNT